MYTCDIDCVVLGAGQGSRMLDLTGGGAKCLIPVAGHPLLYYSLKILEENGFKSAIITGAFIFNLYDIKFIFVFIIRVNKYRYKQIIKH